MLSFNVEAKDLKELAAKVDGGYFDKSIKDYLFSILRDEKINYNPADLFDIHADVKDQEESIYICNSDEHIRSLGSEAREINKRFNKRINDIFDSITEEQVRNRYGCLINAKKLFIDIEKFGMPEFLYYGGSIHQNGKPSSIDINDYCVILKSGEMNIEISWLGDYLRLSPGGRPANLIASCKKCYDIVDSNAEHTGFYIYWRA